MHVAQALECRGGARSARVCNTLSREQLAESVARGLRGRGFSVELREPSASTMFDTSVSLVSTGIVLRVQERPTRSDLSTIEEVVRAALLTHAMPRRRTRAVPVALGAGGRVLTWIDVFG